MPRIAPKIELTAAQRQELQRIARASSSSVLENLRARIILLAETDHPNNEIASALEISEPMVSKWRSRFVRKGMAGLADAPRSGRPLSLSAHKLNAVLTEVSRPPQEPQSVECSQHGTPCRGFQESSPTIVEPE